MLSSMKYYGVCQCLYQHYSLFYHVDCNKQHDQNSFPMVITFIITTTRGEIMYVEETEQSFLKNTCQVLAPLLLTIYNDIKLCLLNSLLHLIAEKQ